ncbi:aldehyde dehydrogenase family protein [Paenibacillus sepulcri]|uniref:aldehyde dehydrogenase (NAD(+)) n=1 Tax=Paenibacillus sepulcri TaxID=359917 RepID=A0ABS7BYY9_9BACL|nr:aldehyde dehydrogenase family protein [Paenibacillus sepulcri]
MKIIDQLYINGQFVKPHGTEIQDLINPSTKEIIGKVTLANEQDTRDAIAAAKKAFKTFKNTSVEERAQMLQRLHDAVLARTEELNQAFIEEYGSTAMAAPSFTDISAKNFLLTKETVEEFEFTKQIGTAKVVLEPLGVVGMITPWNANYTYITSKLAAAIAAGCTAVIKPSELSAIQTRLITECLHEANIPAGVINIVTGTGAVVGAEITRHPDIAMISFTGSTQVGKIIARGAVDTMKRVTLELGGKSPNIMLDDADLNHAVPLALMLCFGNNGQTCMAGTRLIVPEHRLEEVKAMAKAALHSFKVGDPREADTAIGPVVTQKQYDNVQRYIRLGIEEGAELVAGGEGHPEGLEHGYFVKPTIFAKVTRNMTIAKEEIFGPVLSILTYKTEEEAVEIANDTIYGLAAYISSTNLKKASQIASQIESGTVMINGVMGDMSAPFGGFKQSGIGREFGVYGLEEYLETKAISGYEEAGSPE